MFPTLVDRAMLLDGSLPRITLLLSMVDASPPTSIAKLLHVSFLPIQTSLSLADL